MPTEVITGSSEFQPATIDFNLLHEKAMAFEPTPPAPPTAPVAADVAPASPSVSVDPTPTLATAAPPAEPPLIDLPDDARIKIKVDGQEQIVSVKEYRDGIQREASYTKRMQTLADQRREAERVFTEKQAELEQQARAIVQAQQYMQAFQQRPPQAPPAAQPPVPVSGDPNEIATLGEVQQALTALQQNFATQTQAQQQEFMRQLEVAGQRIREEQSLQSEAAKFSNALDKLLTSEDYKIINDVLPFAQDSLRFQVAQLDPQSMDEAIQMMENIAKEWVGKIRSTNTDYLRRQEVARAQAVMEPSTGSPVPPVHVQPKAGTFLKKDGTMDWNTLRQRALSMLDAK